MILREDSGNHRFELVFSIFDRNQLNCGSYQIFIGRNKVQTFDLRIENDTFDRLVEDQRLVEGATGGIFGET